MKLREKAVIGAFLSLTMVRTGWPVDIAVAPFAVIAADPAVDVGAEERRFTEAFIRQVEQQDGDRLLSLSSIPPEPEKRPVSSAAEASRVAALYGYDYVLYGRVAVGDTCVDSGLSLFSREAQRVEKRFYSKVARSELSEAESDLAGHLVTYARQAFGLSNQVGQYGTDLGGITVTAGMGSWIPLGNWKDAVRGVVESFAGIRVIPAAPLRRGADWLSYFRFGGEVRYSFGVNAQSVVPSRVHSFELLLPAELCLESDRHGLVSFGLSPELRIVYAYQQTAYAHPTTGLWNAFGVCGTVGYEYWSRGRRHYAVGTRVAIGAVVLDPILVHLSLDIYGAIRIGATEPGSDAAKNR